MGVKTTLAINSDTINTEYIETSIVIFVSYEYL
jgi:hypothetical protein